VLRTSVISELNTLLDDWDRMESLWESCIADGVVSIIILQDTVIRYEAANRGNFEWNHQDQTLEEHRKYRRQMKRRNFLFSFMITIDSLAAHMKGLQTGMLTFDQCPHVRPVILAFMFLYSRNDKINVLWTELYRALSKWIRQHPAFVPWYIRMILTPQLKLVLIDRPWKSEKLSWPE